MKQNLGKLDRILRFALAFWFLGPFAPYYGIQWLDWLIFGVGVIALIESFTAWCLGHQLLKINNKNQ